MKRTIALIGILAFILACPSFAENEPPQKKALLIGIDKYHNSRYNLRGCNNDVQMMRHLLINRYGFKPENVKTLTDENATLANIRKASNDCLIKGVKPGDFVIFYYSGHGTRTVDENGDEADGYDEALCPADIKMIKGKPQNLLLDDELWTLLNRSPAKDKIVVMDCCFAGTASKKQYTKDIMQGGVRFIDPKLPKTFSPETVPDEKSVESGGSEIPWIHVSAANANQKAQESAIMLGQDPAYCGLFTKTLYRVLIPKKDGTYDEFEKLTKRLVMQSNPNQEPRVEGDYKNRLVFIPKSMHGDTSKGAKFIYKVIETFDDGTVKLNCGAAGNTTVGSRYAVFKPADKPVKIGEVEIISVNLVSSKAKILKGGLKITKDCTIKEITHRYGRKPVKVFVGKFKEADRIKEYLKKTGFIKTIDSKGFADRVVAPDPDGKGFVLYARDGSILRRFNSPDINTNLIELKKTVTAAYVIKRLAALNNPNADFQVKLNLKSGRYKYPVGDEIAFQFTPTADCYLILLHVSSDGEMTVLFPNKFSAGNFVKKGQVYNVPPFRDGNYLFKYEIAGPTGQEMVKAVATREYVDPWEIAKDTGGQVFKSIKGNPEKVVDNLFVSLNRMFGGEDNFTRDSITIPTGALSGSSWTTDSVTFIINSKKKTAPLKKGE